MSDQDCGYTPGEWKKTCLTTLCPLHWAAHETILVIPVPHAKGQVPVLNTRLFTPTEAQQPLSLHLMGPLLSLLYISQLMLWPQRPSHPYQFTLSLCESEAGIFFSHN